MARRGTHHLWLVVLLVAAGIGVAGVAMADGSEAPPSRNQSAGVRVTPPGVDLGVVPGPTEAASGKAANPISGRTLLPLVAALVALVGLVGLAAARRAATPDGARPLLARRHAIALRAPPFQLV